MTNDTSSDPIQILTYIRRRQTLTPEQFYDHWENVHAGKVIPWAEKHGIIRYQQIHTTGSIVPVPSTSSAPNAISSTPLPTEPVSFDGIAMFLVPSLEQFMEAFKDEYYIQVIEPDERVMLDKEGPGSGVVASFQGRMVGLVESGKEVGKVNEKTEDFREVWEAFERKKQ